MLGFPSKICSRVFESRAFSAAIEAQSTFISKLGLRDRAKNYLTLMVTFNSVVHNVFLAHL